MNRVLRDISIKRKLMLIAMLASVVALALAAAGLVSYDFVTFREGMVRNLTVQADIIGANSTGALTFNNPKDAGEVLAALRSEPQIVAAEMFDERGAFFAMYRRGDAPPRGKTAVAPAAGHAFQPNRLTLARRITLNGDPIGTVYLESDLSAMYARYQRYAGIVLVVLLASGGAAFWLAARLQRVVSAPILDLARMTRAISTGKNYSLRAEKRGHDELGELIDGFNEMLAQIQARDAALQQARNELEQRVNERTQELIARTVQLELEIAERHRAQVELEDLHKRLLDTSRQAGMAEVATAVLHNVGNVLNSVNVSTTLLAENIRQSKVPSLARLADLLREHANDLGGFIANDPKGKLLPGYIQTLAGHLAEEQAGLLAELDHLTKNIDHIKDIVVMQQSYAKVSGVVENLPAVDLVEDAFQMNAAALNRHGIAVVREYEEVPAVSVEKHKVLQILVNLMRNAKYAMDAASRADKQLTLRIHLNGDNRVKISVADNGIGIAPENLTKVFSHGFTTKRDGHGFGLHSGAIAARELGGSLTAASGGLGQGATFTLELPLAAANDVK